MLAREIDFRPNLIPVPELISLFRECTPRLLVVTDGLNFDANDDFGLTQFVTTLETSTIHGMTPQVVKAHRNSDSNADIEGFRFDDPTNGLIKSRYDVVFLFGIARQFSPIDAAETDAIAAFMQAGGGVFATGDHEDLGAGMSKDVPRVREMRYWLSTETPDIRDTSRLSTNLAGDNGVFEFNDQADTHPQTLYVNYRTDAGGVGDPHPLLDAGPLGVVDVFPDHPHEGECHIPGDLTTTFTLNGDTHDEWPNATSGAGRVSPEMVAMSMSHGDAFPGKEALVPRSFMAIAAYDGHRAGVGRVSTDATWHHFVNVNIDGTDSPRSGLQDPPGTDTPEMERIRVYYQNIATWLMPKNVRRCLRFPWIIRELKRFPLFEEVRVPELDGALPEDLRDLGQQFVSAMQARGPRWRAESLIQDALEDAVGEKRAAELMELDASYGRLSGREVGLAALGGTVAGVVSVLADVKAEKGPIDPKKTFDPMVRKSASMAVRKFQERSLNDIVKVKQRMEALG